MPSPYGLESVKSCVTCTLRADSFFCSLPGRSLRFFDKVQFSSLLPSSAFLFAAGQKANGFYLVCQGRVKLSVHSAEGYSMLVKVVGPGSVLGLHACLKRIPHELSAETLQPCRIAFVKNRDLVRFMRQRTNQCWRTAKALSEACYSAHEILQGVGFHFSSCARIARFILDLAASADGTGRPPLCIELPFTQQDIARAMPMSRATLRYKLAKFQEHGVAVLEGRTLTIRNPEALVRIASGAASPKTASTDHIR